MGEVCARPGCAEPAWALLEFSVSELTARLLDMPIEPSASGTPLCARHADRTSVPRGWELTDQRTARVGGRAALFPAPVPVETERDDEAAPPAHEDGPLLQRAFGSGNHPTARRR